MSFFIPFNIIVMAKLNSCLIAFGFLFLICPNFDQAQVIVTLFQPPPNQWNVADLWNLSLTNPTSTSHQIFLYGTVESDNDGVIFSGTSAEFNLAANFSGRIPVQNLEPADVGYANGEYEETVRRTGMLPEGTYTICITVKEVISDKELGKTCIKQPIMHPSPPQLVSPIDESIVKESLPSFVWIPPAPLTGVGNVLYTLRIVELLDGQVPIEAMDANPAFYTDKNIMSTNQLFPISARPFVIGNNYAWQVTAISSKQHFEIGKSEVWSFTYGGEVKSEKKQCDLYKKELKESRRGDTIFYAIKVSNKYSGKSEELIPTGFKLRILADSIVYSARDVNKEWKRTVGKKPPDTIDMQWKSSRGIIPEGQSFLGQFYLVNSSGNFQAFFYWYNQAGQLLCKDSTQFSQSLVYYSLTDRITGNYLELSDSSLNVQFVNNYASVKNLYIRIYDAGTRTLVPERKESDVPLKSLNGINRLTVNTSNFTLQDGKSYLLTVSDLVNIYYLNFKIARNEN
jgi:hypothetical protein